MDSEHKISFLNQYLPKVAHYSFKYTEGILEYLEYFQQGDEILSIEGILSAQRLEGTEYNASQFGDTRQKFYNDATKPKTLGFPLVKFC